MHLNEALFSDNGGCGYVLKPDILTNPYSRFDPANKNTTSNKKVLDVKIISAQQLPKPDDYIDDIADPYGIDHNRFDDISKKW